MPTPDLQNYIAQSRQQGMTDDQIRQNLIGQGWQEADILQAIAVGPTPVSMSPNKRPKPLLIWLIVTTLISAYFVPIFMLGGIYVTFVLLLFLLLVPVFVGMWVAFGRRKMRLALILSFIVFLLLSPIIYALYILPAISHDIPHSQIFSRLSVKNGLMFETEGTGSSWRAVVVDFDSSLIASYYAQKDGSKVQDMYSSVQPKDLGSIKELAQKAITENGNSQNLVPDINFSFSLYTGGKATSIQTHGLPDSGALRDLYILFQNKKYYVSNFKIESAPASQTNSPVSTGTTSNTNNSASSSLSQVCGELPRGGSAYYTLSSSPPADYPSDIPVYPNGNVAGYYRVPGKTSNLIFLATCTDDSIDKVTAYFITNGTVWNIENPYAGSVNNNARGSLDNGKTLTGDQGNKNLLIDISKTSAGTKTWILSEVIFNNK